MVKPTAKQINIPDQHYACTNCGMCCRDLYLHVTPDDLKRLDALKWPAGTGPTGPITTTINGVPYLAHQLTDGAEHCVFLDPATNLCKIHGQFGAAAKPLGCRVYPYNIAPTFADRYSVVARHDCPAVREPGGTPIREDLPAIRDYMSHMRFRSGFDSDTCDGLTEATIETYLRQLFAEVLNNKALTTRGKMLCALLAAQRAERLGAPFLNDSGVSEAELYGSFYERIRSDAAALEPREMSAVERLRFYLVLMAYLRRDDSFVLKGRSARLRRSWGMLGIFLRSGSGSDLGTGHPDVPISQKLLFDEPLPDLDAIDWSRYLDLVRVRLQAYQFFGDSNFDYSFWDGLKTLFFTFPLVIAAAKWSASARDEAVCTITTADIDYAIGAIDHSFGRSAFLKMPTFTILTRQMVDPPAYQRLLHYL